MAGTRLGIFKRIIWPARASLFALIGGAVGLFGDLASFFAEFLSADVLVLVFGTVTAVAALLCLQRAFIVNSADDAAVEAVVQCAPCDAFRFGLFATAVFVVLMLIGQGKSATETIGRQLGLIQRDVSAIRDDVSDLHAMAQPQMIIKRPRSAADYFNNAWVYQNIQRNPAQAYREMQVLYAAHAPRRLDAAQLYFDAGQAVTARAGLLDEMQALARRTNDATLLVVAARAAPTREDGDRMIEEARRMDPELPFVWWDILRPQTQLANRTTPAERAAAMRADVARIDKFRTLFAARPTAQFFFLPQYQGDLEGVARQMADSLKQNIETYDDIASGRLAARTRAEAKRAMEEARRNR
jgi:hypothetical protein